VHAGQLALFRQIVFALAIASFLDLFAWVICSFDGREIVQIDGRRTEVTRFENRTAVSF
jgi:hypothetical protein